MGDCEMQLRSTTRRTGQLYNACLRVFGCADPRLQLSDSPGPLWRCARAAIYMQGRRLLQSAHEVSPVRTERMVRHQRGAGARTSLNWILL